MKLFPIAGVEVPKKTVRRIDIELPGFYGAPSYMRCYVMRGARSGPTAFVSAAVHGDELNGIEIIRRLRNLNLLRRLRGTLILIPVVNTYGVQNLSRYLPDRRDLNRSFPGSPKGSLASRVANTFYEEVVSKCDFGIDLHTAAIHKSNLPQIRTNLDNDDTREMAEVFGAPVILHSQLRDGSLRACAQERELPILLYEAGEALRLDEKSIKVGVRGIVNVLRFKGMLPKKHTLKKPKQPMVTRNSSWIRATQSGMIHTLKKLGEMVNKDDVIAVIHDLIEDESIAIKATFDGIIIGKTQIPLAHEGDALFHIASFGDLKMAEEHIEDFYEVLHDS